MVNARSKKEWWQRLLAMLFVCGPVAALLPMGAQSIEDTPPSPAPASPLPPLPLMGDPRALGVRIDSSFAKEFAELEGAVLARWQAPPADRLTDFLMSAALVDVLEADPVYTRPATGLLTRALDRLRISPDPELAMHVGLAFAWISPSLPEEERSVLAGSVLELAKQFDEQARTLGPLEPERPPAEGAALLLARSLLHTSQAPEGRVLYQRSSGRWLTDVLPALAQIAGDDGGLTGGPVRSSLSVEASTYALELLSRDRGTDLFRKYPFPKRSWVFQRYTRLTEPGGFLPFDDTAGRGAIQADRRGARILPLLAARYGNGVLQAGAARRRPSDPVDLWPYFLWFDPTLEPRSPPEWPLAYNFERLGLVAARTRWTDDATAVGFRAGPQLFSTQQDDPGGLVLYHDGWVLPTAAGRDVRSRDGHNTLAYWSPRRGLWTALPTSASASRAEAGKGLEPLASPVEGAGGARIVAFETGPHFTYFAADLSAACRDRLKSAIRHVLLVPDPTGKADVVVVCDLVEPGADRDDVRPAALWHWPTRPDYEPFDQVLTATTGSTRTFCVLEAPARAAVETEAVEGPTGAVGLPATLYRTVVRAEEPSPAELFLSIFCITDSSADMPPVDAFWMDGGMDQPDMDRFLVQMDWESQTCLVAFNADGSPGGSIYLEEVTKGKVILSRELSSSVQPQRADDLLGRGGLTPATTSTSQ